MSLMRRDPGAQRAGFSLWVVWLVLAAATAAVYHGLPGHRFVNFDDPMYLYENSQVTAGFTSQGLVWAWTSMDTLQWQPLTWMAHMAVSELGGMQPGAHLAANVLLHVLNAGLLFLLVRAVTGAEGRSLVVALLFAVHPVNVETVAWASQLKSTLSTAFALAGLLAYVRASRSGARFSFTALGCLALSLLAKPMMVMFPLLLLLLDFWPLRQMPSSVGRDTWGAWGRLLGSKLPFFLIAGAVAFVTAKPWGTHAEMAALNHLEWERVAAVPWNYLVYLRMLFWPVGLAVLYPSRLDYPLLLEAGALAVLLGVSLLVWRQRRHSPERLLGWGWFVVTILPVSGLMRIGPQDLADRYLYVPGIGVLMVVVWAGADGLRARAPWLCRPVVGGLALALGLGAASQVAYWADSVTLWRRAAAVTRPNATQHINLGNALLEAGHAAEAETEFREAIELQPDNPRPYVNLAVIEQQRGHPSAAVALFRRALALAPTDARVLSNLGSLLDDVGQAGEAAALLEKAVSLNPSLPEAWINLGVLRAKAGAWVPARDCFEAALRLRPGHPETLRNLALLRRQMASQGESAGSR